MQGPGKANVTIDLESPIEGKAVPGNILCTSGDKQLALLTVSETPRGRIALLNTHTYRQADFDAVGEVLLCPRPLGLLGINGPALSALREVFGSTTFDGPACVTYHPLGPAGFGNCVIQNFNDKAVNVTVTVQIQKDKSNEFVDAFSGKSIKIQKAEPGNHIALDIPIPTRSRVWIRHVD